MNGVFEGSRGGVTRGSVSDEIECVAWDDGKVPAGILESQSFDENRICVG
jgi:hypothetical protein